jgi:hypothetical protein
MWSVGIWFVRDAWISCRVQTRRTAGDACLSLYGQVQIRRRPILLHISSPFLSKIKGCKVAYRLRSWFATLNRREWHWCLYNSLLLISLSLFFTFSLALFSSCHLLIQAYITSFSFSFWTIDTLQGGGWHGSKSIVDWKPPSSWWTVLSSSPKHYSKCFHCWIFTTARSMWHRHRNESCESYIT